MNKKIIGIGILGMFLLTSVTALSAVVEDESVPLRVYGENHVGGWSTRVYGYVTNLNEQPIEGARVWIVSIHNEGPWCWCDYYENEYCTGSDGFYEFTGVYNNDLQDSGFCMYDCGVTKAGYSKIYPVLTTLVIYAGTLEKRVDFILIKNPFTRDIQSSQSSSFSSSSSSSSSSIQSQQYQSIPSSSSSQSIPLSNPLLLGGQSNN